MSDRHTCDMTRVAILNASDGSGPGYISSVVSRDHGYGSGRCPWSLRARPGQRLRLSVFNLARGVASGGGGGTGLQPLEDPSDPRRQVRSGPRAESMGRVIVWFGGRKPFWGRGDFNI